MLWHPKILNKRLIKVGSYSILFLHFASFSGPRGAGLRDDRENCGIQLIQAFAVALYQDLRLDGTNNHLI